MKTEFKNKQEALDAIKSIERYIETFDSNKESNKLVEMEKLFLELLNQGLTLKVDSVCQIINYFDKEEGQIISIELKDKIVWFAYNKFWGLFNSKLELNYHEIKAFLNDMVDKYLNCKEFTTRHLF